MNKEQTATIIPNHTCKYTRAHRREQNGFIQEIAALVMPEPGDRHREMRAIVNLRIYGTAARNYACIWTLGKEQDHHRNGSGVAGGYGYHRPSAAAQEAIQNAGFTLSQRIDGVGDSAMREAVMAIAAALGYPEACLHIAHA